MADALETGSASSAARWSVIIPAYNEEDFLRQTVDSILAQTIPARIILVDNRSTDGTRALMENIAGAAPDGAVVILSDDRPGKINALETGIAALATDFVALCDADTIYPPDYLATAQSMMETRNAVGAFAFGVYDNLSRRGAAAHLWARRLAAALRPQQGHTGGFGHAFRTKALRDAGGYSANIWPYMVADHEVVNRVLKIGPVAYSHRHYCITSSRRVARGRVDWRLGERLFYNLLPHRFHDWFFRDYLAPRFEARRMYNSNLRQRDWENAENLAVSN